ncbi:MAG: sodium:solute symporter family protein [Betaproteobacteria bacterium]|nr:sodium:solute symporter family protein [Betaproteobacteria bacterium]
MLIWFVIIYLIIAIGIGLYAATKVHNARDYVVAGRSLPLYMVTATVFATWFGSETVLGTSTTFLQEGLHGIVADPFGASMCLILVGLFFARKLYRMNLLTIGDYYRIRYGRAVETLTGIAIVVSYLGWVSAQITAIGLVFSLVSQGQITPHNGMLIGSAIVLIYTIFGGMWSIALHDFLQMNIILIGMLYIAWIISGDAGGVSNVIAHANAEGKFAFWPKLSLPDVLAFIGAWVTMMFGSIPQQDVFQRIMSAKNERVAVQGSVLGGSMYFLFAFIPIFLAYSTNLIDPNLVKSLINAQPQHILPEMILHHTPIFAQIMFFGALLSSILSTASAALLAPSITFTENVIKPLIGDWGERHLLLVMRSIVVIFAGVVAAYALSANTTIFNMVENAYKITLVTAFVPLTAGIYWKRANNQGALLAIIAGASSWVWLETTQPDGLWPPQLFGLLMSVAGMILGSLLPNLMSKQDIQSGL